MTSSDYRIVQVSRWAGAATAGQFSSLSEFRRKNPIKALESGIAGAEDVFDPEEKEKKEKKDNRPTLFRVTKDSLKTSKESSDPYAFKADMLAQAGLFAGSSLLFNPNLTVQREQLEVLRSIDRPVAGMKSPFA